MKKLLLSIILILLFTSGDAHAAAWYVDKATAGDGTSWANAWSSFASVVWGGGGVTAGDTVFVSGGASGTTKVYSTGATEFIIGASGTAGNPIFIKAGQEVGHNGVAVFDYTGVAEANVDPDNFVAFNLSSRDYLHIDGEYQGERHIQFRHLTDPGDGTVNGTVFYASPAGKGLKIRYIEVDSTNTFVTFLNTNNDAVENGPEISYNRATNMIGDVIIRVFPDTPPDLNELDWALIHHNYLEVIDNNTVEASGGPDAIQASWGISVYDNTILTTASATTITVRQHPDGWQANGHDLKFYNNLVINCGDAMLMGSDVGSADGIDRYYIYNNVFVIEDDQDTIPEMIRLFNISTANAFLTDILIANNLFVDSDFGTTRGVLYIGGNHTNITGDITIKNNIFYNSGNPTYDIYFIPPATAIVWDISNNIYYTEDDPDMQFEGNTYNVAGFIAAIEPSGTALAPSFVAYTENDSTSDYRLTVGDTVAKDQGVDLSAYFTTDKDGNTRGGAWDIGPYEFGSGTSPIVSVTSSGSPTEDGTTGTFTISINSGGSEWVTYTLGGGTGAVWGTDAEYPWEQIGGVTISSAISATTTFQPIQDSAVESTEEFWVTLTQYADPTTSGITYALGTSGATLTLIDDDNPAITISSGGVPSEDGGTGTFTFDATAGISRWVVFDRTATAGGSWSTDECATGDVAGIVNSGITVSGDISGVTVMTVCDDAIVDPGEQFTITILDSPVSGVSYTGADNSASLTVVDNDSPSGLQFDEFGDAYQASYWLNDLGAGGTTKEVAGVFQLGSGTAGTYNASFNSNFLYQEDITGDFDVWAVFEHPGYITASQAVGIIAKFTGDVTYVAISQKMCCGGTTNYEWSNTFDGTTYADQTVFDSTRAWMRMARSGGSFYPYYATSDPLSGGVWQSTPENDREIFSIADIQLGIYAGNTSGVSHTGSALSFLGWTGYPTSPGKFISCPPGQGCPGQLTSSPTGRGKFN